MRYEVISTPDAENDLATLWVDAEDRGEIVRVADQMDDLLTEDAHIHGESREEISRVMIVLPFVVEFDVIESARTVFVTGIWKAKRR